MTDHLTPSELALLQAAEKATKGEWFVAHRSDVRADVPASFPDHQAQPDGSYSAPVTWGTYAEVNAAYIVAAQPRVVLALLEEIGRLRGVALALNSAAWQVLDDFADGVSCCQAAKEQLGTAYLAARPLLNDPQGDHLPAALASPERN